MNEEQASLNKTDTSNNKPSYQLRAGAFQLTCWENTTTKDGKTFMFKNFSLQRSWEKDGVWHNEVVNNIRMFDLMTLSTLVTKAYTDEKVEEVKR